MTSTTELFEQMDSIVSRWQASIATLSNHTKGEPYVTLKESKLQAEVERLRASNAELLTALVYIVTDFPTPGGEPQLTAKGYELAWAAINRAEKGE